ncbi:MAG: hypothetical protein IPM98_15200 [Lewinellaceae bacterium]|nr:hypothetical protein [Lewinellaceae bacterium]
MFQQDVFQGPGTGTFTSHTFEIIFMLLVAGLIGLWLGWVLWSRYRQIAEKLQIENTSLSASITALRQEVDGLKTKLTEAESERATLENRVQGLTWESENQRTQFTILQSDMEKILARNRQLETELGLNAEPETNALAGTIPLEVEIPGTSPAEETVEPEGVFADEAPGEAELQPESEPVAEAVEVPAVPEAPSVPEQQEGVTFIAPVARGSIVPLSELNAMPYVQDPAATTTTTLHEAEAPMVVAAVTDGPRDDLKIVEGIGPKIEQLLFKAGVTTYGQLAATSVQHLKDILVEAGPRYAMHDPGTWSAQALLAANGEWENLKAYQDFLNAGKRPDKN